MLDELRRSIPGGVGARISATPLRKAGTGREVGAAAAFLLGLRVFLLAVRRGRFGFRRTVTCHFHMTHEEAGLADWTSLIGGWLAGVAR